jgi:hypothetical protein
MIAISAVAVVVLFAQAEPAPSSSGRYRVTLEFHGVWGLANEANGTCPGVTPGTDILTGIVERSGASDEGIEYAGALARTTHVGLCEASETADGTRWCAGEINGGGTFRVIITIPPRGRDNENASVAMKPDVNVHAQVGGTCDSLDNAGVADDYEDGDTLYFETSNHAAGRVPPTGGLAIGTFFQTRRIEPDRGYMLKVERP